MAIYITQHRRGTINQWAEKNTIIPLEGEIVIEIDEENHLHKLKIGDGIHTYSELAYLQAGDEIVTQVLRQARDRIITVTLDVDQWTEVTCATDPRLGYYGQVIALDGITKYSRLDLQPDADMLAEFQQLNLVFVTENKDGIITAYSVGDMPLKSYTMQATIVEADIEEVNEKVVGMPVGTPTAKSDWAQADEMQADYIKNKPDVYSPVVGSEKPTVDTEGHMGQIYIVRNEGTSNGEIYIYRGSHRSMGELNSFNLWEHISFKSEHDDRLRYLEDAVGEDDYAGTLFERVAELEEQSSKDVIIQSSTAGSNKKFKITVDDNGTISAVEVNK